jgi:peptide/nickel transport system substrate-binding protein
VTPSSSRRLCLSRRGRRAVGAVALVGAATLALGGCASFDDGSASAADTTSITVALTGEPSSLDPLYDTQLPALNIFYNVFDQLAQVDADGSVSPRLASGWTHDDSLTSWVFTLRDDAAWQDGTDVTAEDVVFTYETAMSDPASNLGGYLSAVESVVATGEDEVTFTLNTPFAPFDRQVTLVPIIPKAVYEAEGAAAFAKAPVGSGPYSVASWVNGDSITLERNDDYWGEKGAYEEVVFQPVPDETTRANSVQSGDLDLALLGPSNVAAVEGSGTVDVVEQESNRVLYTGFNATAPWLSDPSVREAVDLAIDRTAISEDLLGGAVTPTGQLIAPVSFGYDEALPATETDADAARELITASGYDGSPITLSYPTNGLPQIDQIAQAVASQLEAVGLTIELDGQEANTFSGTWFSASLPGLYLYAFAPSVMDADLPLTMLLKTGGQGYVSDPAIDELLAAETGEADETARADDFAQISALVDENTYYAPLFTDTYTYGVAQGLDWSPRPDGMLVFN